MISVLPSSTLYFRKQLLDQCRLLFVCSFMEKYDTEILNLNIDVKLHGFIRLVNPKKARVHKLGRKT